MLHKRFWVPILCGILCLIGLLLARTPVSAASSSEIRDQITAMEQEQEAIRQQITQLEQQISTNATELKQLVANKQSLDQQINLLHRQIDNSNQQIAAYALLIADKQLELDKAEENLARFKMEYKERIRAMEESDGVSYWLILFESRSFTDFLDRLEMVRQIAKADQHRMETIRLATQQVQQAQAELAAEKAALESARLALTQTRQQLEAKAELSGALVLELVNRGDEYAQLLEQAEQDEEKLMDEIAKLEDDFDDAVYQEWLATYVPPTTAPETPTVGDSGWLTPVTNYRLSSPFGNRLHPILGIYRMHSGVDMACPEWTPIYATRGGKITIAKYSDSAGNYVQINHGDGYASVYMHMVQHVVSVGDYVAQGQVIGYVGNTGLSKGNHLHFGISYNGEYVNPMEYID
ncbi:MAG: hypothetical protein E7439_06995 [Ruminococcaceae bacterium]|nr:hypothetical protein [Oscillospiraceae bacterium]